VKFSKKFQKIIDDEGLCRKLTASCGAIDVSFEHWTKMRSFIAKAIHMDGTILDVGCGSGFLLRCLMEWSDYKLTLFGIDENESYIELTEKILPKKSVASLKINWHIHKDELDMKSIGLPESYTFVYWNVWDVLMFEKGSSEYEYEMALIKNIAKLAKERLILGFYDSDKKKKEKISNLEKEGFKFESVIENYSVPLEEPPEMLAWIDYH